MIHLHMLILMVHAEYKQAAIGLRRASTILREEWLAHKKQAEAANDHVNAKFFKSMASDEMKRFRALDYLIQWSEGVRLEPPSGLEQVINAALVEVDLCDSIAA